MKRIITLILLFLAFAAYAQNKPQLSPDCIKYMSFYQQLYKEKNFESALPNWRNAMKFCPANASQNMYVHGTTMMTKLYDKTSDANYRQAIADTILMLQDIRIRNYPQKKTEILNNKGLYMVKYKGNDTRYLYDNLPVIITELGGAANVNLDISLFKATMNLFKAKSISDNDLMQIYDLVSESLDAQTPSTDEQKANQANAQTIVTTLFADSGVADCQSIIKAFSPRFDKDPENASLAATIIRLMNATEDCAGTELYFRAVTTLHKQSSSHKSAYALYRMNAARNNTADACTYLEQAIESEDSDIADKAKYTYELGLFAYKNKLRNKAYEAARKAIELDCGYAGKAYLLIGNLWSSALCDDELSQYARYWAATDNYQKAKELDPSIEKDANSALASAAKHYPEPSEIFMFDLQAGQSYTVSCSGMSARTTVRTKKH